MTEITSLALRQGLLNLQLTQRLMDKAQLRLATGKEVNSGIDGADRFFASQTLLAQSQDLANLLENLGQNLQTIEMAQNGIEGVTKLLELAQSKAQTALDQQAFAPNQSLSDQILEDDPVAYYRLNELAGPAINLGSGAVGNASYQSGVTRGAAALYEYQGEPSAQFDGINDRVVIPNSNDINVGNQPVRTVELVFNADETTNRQILFEEGGGTNNLAIYIQDGQVWATTRDAGDFGPFVINQNIEAGETYHVAVTFDSVDRNDFRAYLNGEEFGREPVTQALSSHTGGIGVGRLNGSTFFHDGNQGGNGAAFRGRISDVAIHNSVISEERLRERADALEAPDADLELQQDFSELRSQIDQLTRDASYRGVNLLRGDAMQSIFSTERNSVHVTQGEDITSYGLGLENLGLDTEENARLALSAIQSALEKVRSFSSTLSTDLSIISTRETFIGQGINTREEGSSKLVDADINAESAKLLSLNTTLQLGHNALFFINQSRSNIGQLLFR